MPIFIRSNGMASDRFANLSASLLSAFVRVFLIGLISEKIIALIYRRDE
ncbi:MAG: hypothetical protein ACRETA_13500 [Gammaproteobacteria bacterium]